MAEIPRNNTGLSGEYFVAAELYRRGWSVGLTMGNAKSVDLFAEMDNLLIQVQVKAIFKRKNVGWPLMTDKIKDGCFYVFVNLNADKMTSPDYYIATSEEVRARIKQYTTRGIVDLSTVNSEEFVERWDKLMI